MKHINIEMGEVESFAPTTGLADGIDKPWHGIPRFNLSPSKRSYTPYGLFHSHNWGDLTMEPKKWFATSDWLRSGSKNKKTGIHLS